MSSDRPFLSDGGDRVGDVLESVDLSLLLFRLALSFCIVCKNPLIVDMAEVASLDAEFLGGLG